MKNSTLFLILLFFVVLILNVMRAQGRSENEESINSSRLNAKRVHNSTSKLHSQKKVRTLFRLTASKLLLLILTVILSGLFVYYFFLFYPILCRKERNYDVVDHSRDTTPIPNPEKI